MTLRSWPALGLRAQTAHTAWTTAASFSERPRRAARAREVAPPSLRHIQRGAVLAADDTAAEAYSHWRRRVPRRWTSPEICSPQRRRLGQSERAAAPLQDHIKALRDEVRAAFVSNSTVNSSGREAIVPLCTSVSRCPMVLRCMKQMRSEVAHHKLSTSNVVTFSAG